MKYSLVALILLAVFIGCSKSNDDEKVVPPIDMDILEQAKILANDSSNLTIISYSGNSSGEEYSGKAIFMGIRGKKFWVGVFPWLDAQVNGFNIGKELCSYTTLHDYELTRQIGYGETFKVNDIEIGIWGDVDKREFEMCIIGRENEFVDASISTDFVIIRKDQECYYEDCDFYHRKKAWYDSSMLFWNEVTNNATLYSYEGMKLYDISEFYWLNFRLGIENIEAINIEEGIYFGNDLIGRVNIKNYKDDHKFVWVKDIVYQLGLDENQEPRLTYYIEQKQHDEWSYKVDILNLNGSEETRKFKINIETGEITEI